MSKINDGEPAFPCELHSVEGVQLIAKFPGMSLRDWLAGQALAGWMSEPLISDKWPVIASAACYKVADAMLAEREKS